MFFSDLHHVGHFTVDRPRVHSTHHYISDFARTWLIRFFCAQHLFWHCQTRKSAVPEIRPRAPLLGHDTGLSLKVPFSKFTHYNMVKSTQSRSQWIWQHGRRNVQNIEGAGVRRDSLAQAQWNSTVFFFLRKMPYDRNGPWSMSW